MKNKDSGTVTEQRCQRDMKMECSMCP
jgi:hypothetical protein